MSMLVGIFVGGAASRMGGVAKGLLLARDRPEPLVSRLARIAGEALPGCEIVLVGRSDAYRQLEWRALDDAPGRSGPIAGLVALLETAARGERTAIALACDLPAAPRELIARLATHMPGAAAVAPRLAGRWQPLFARYAPGPCLAAAQSTSAPWRVLDAVHAAELPLTDDERALLRDWDTPGDVERG
jgi:molybdopterin-guanine dinucleotide biosynthesis protein A